MTTVGELLFAHISFFNFYFYLCQRFALLCVLVKYPVGALRKTLTSDVVRLVSFVNEPAAIL